MALIGPQWLIEALNTTRHQNEHFGPAAACPNLGKPSRSKPPFADITSLKRSADGVPGVL
jgi:hypothetical protein